MPPSADGTLAPIEAFQQQGREVNDPAVDRRMIDTDAALGHHFLQIAKAQAVGQIPANAKQNDGLVEMAALEHLNSPAKHQRPCPCTWLPKTLEHSLLNSVLSFMEEPNATDSLVIAATNHQEILDRAYREALPAQGWRRDLRGGRHVSRPRLPTAPRLSPLSQLTSRSANAPRKSDLAHMNRLSVMGELTASLAHEIMQPIGSARNNAFLIWSRMRSTISPARSASPTTKPRASLTSPRSSGCLSRKLRAALAPYFSSPCPAGKGAHEFSSRRSSGWRAAPRHRIRCFSSTGLRR